jgi:hypothetical protein
MFGVDDEDRQPSISYQDDAVEELLLFVKALPVEQRQNAISVIKALARTFHAEGDKVVALPWKDIVSIAWKHVSEHWLSSAAAVVRKSGRERLKAEWMAAWQRKKHIIAEELALIERELEAEVSPP